MPRAALRTLAPAKIILGGEHAVVYGIPALVLPLPTLQTEVQLRETNVPGIKVWLADLPQPSETQMDFVFSACRTILEGLDRPMPDGTLIIHSSVPLASGLGSSASLSVALARAFSRLYGASTDPEAIQALAHAAEHAAHGRASGVDTAAIAWGKPLRYVRHEAPQRLRIAQALTFVVAFSGESGSTSSVVMDLAARREADPERYAQIFEGIAAQVAVMERALAEGDLVALGLAMTENHRLLQDLDVSNATLDRLVTAAHEAGALGAKLTGAGRGGCMIALTTVEKAPALAAALSAAGAAWTRIVTVPAQD